MSRLIGLIPVYLILFLLVQGIMALPKRQGPVVKTTKGVPHVQIDVKPVEKVHKELFNRVFKLPHLHNKPTIISLPGARGLWIDEKVKLKHPEVIVAGREFAHIHPDGSLHISLPPERAKEAVQKGWAIRHPWAADRDGWEGFVMLFTPQTSAELDVTFALIVDGYNFVTGQKVKAADYY